VILINLRPKQLCYAIVYFVTFATFFLKTKYWDTERCKCLPLAVSVSIQVYLMQWREIVSKNSADEMWTENCYGFTHLFSYSKIKNAEIKLDI
jgi:hypothetical protein